MQEYILQEWKQVSVAEIIAVIFAILQVLLAYRNNILTYPAGIVSTVLFTGIFIQSGLYADASLNVYYFVMSIYGWILWRRNVSQQSKPVSHANGRELITAIAIVVVAFVFLFFILKYFTDSVVPMGDACVSAFAWSGMWLMAKRKIENWILLNVSNALAVPLLFYKHLPLTAMLTIFLFIVAVFGYFRWKRIILEEKEKAKDFLKNLEG